jgi:hypothetical protein
LFTGLEKLLDHSMRDAFHDSAARWPPPRCHDGTRKDLIKTITDWGVGASDDAKSILWIHGPFGVGKSALTQTCVEALASRNKLAASLFFSLPNKRDDPNRIFTSIAYQISVKCPSLEEVVDRTIVKNPTLLTASRRIQFEELIVKPLRYVGASVAGMEGWVIVLDGLDECRGGDMRKGMGDDLEGSMGREEQCEIIDIIAASVRNRSTPFRWSIISRPEIHINQSMEHISHLLFTISIPLSPETDTDIRNYLISELKAIGERHRLSPSWPSDTDVAALLKIIAGLWVSAATIVRFVGDRDVSAPITQLCLVLSFGERVQRDMKASSDNPWAQMDLVYHFILQRLPSTIISRVRKILLLNSHYYNTVNQAVELGYILGLSQEDFTAACCFLQSVLYLDESGGSDDPPGRIIKFYHASFMEFMRDKRRSKDFYIYDDCFAELQQEIIDRINKVHDQVCSLGRPGG